MKKSTSSWLVKLSVCLLLATSITTVRADKGDEPVVAVANVTGSGVVKGAHVNVRSRPSTSAEVVAQLNKGDAVQVLGSKSVTEGGKSRDWLNIVLPETARCYVSAKHVKDGVVDGETVYVRSGPGSNYRDLGKLAKGDHVTVVKQQGEWTQIKPTAACTGWVSAELIEMTPNAIPAAPPAARPVSEMTPPPVAPPSAPDKVKVVSTDPDVHIVYVVKVGVVAKTSGEKPPAPFELNTQEVDRLQNRMCYLKAPADTNMARYNGKTVRVAGNLRWYKGDRYPILAADRISIVW